MSRYIPVIAVSWLLVACTTKTPVEILGINNRTIGGPGRMRIEAGTTFAHPQPLWIRQDQPEVSETKSDLCVTIANRGPGYLLVEVAPSKALQLIPKQIEMLTMCGRTKVVEVACRCVQKEPKDKTCERAPDHFCEILWRVDEARPNVLDSGRSSDPSVSGTASGKETAN